MDAVTILKELQAGKIRLEEAKRRLSTLADPVADSSSLPSSKDRVPPASGRAARGPERLGSPVFQRRYGCKWSYFTGSMFRAIASEDMVVAMGNAGLLSFFGSTGLAMETLEASIRRIRDRLGPGKPYGMCFIHNLHDEEAEWSLAKLYIQYGIPVVEAAAYPALTLPLVYYRVKGLTRREGRIAIPRRVIAKCSRMEVARLFLSPPPMELLNQLVREGLITEEERELARMIPMADDLAVEADSGGHTDQGVSFALLPSILSLKQSLQKQYQYAEEVLVGCGGGIGTPEAVASAFMLGADFIFTGSINQCTVESGAHPAIKDILNRITIHDTGLTVAGDMFELGAKAQVVKKYSRFYTRSNRLYSLFTQYDSIDQMPSAIREDLETNYFKTTIDEVWRQVKEYKTMKNPDQLREAEENPRLKMALIFKWYFNHCTKVTLQADLSEKDNFSIYSGPSLGALNQWAKGTRYEHWSNRKVAELAELLMTEACAHISRLVQQYGGEEATAGRNEQVPIAIIGVSGQFPKAPTLDDYWSNLAGGLDCISEVPEERWPVDRFYEPEKKEGKSYSKWMGVLEDADRFDPLFFQISPAEAESMDPQQRLFLENCWHCIEDAGVAPSSLSGTRTGVFVGCGANDYGQTSDATGSSAHALLGGSPSILSARIAYYLNLKGPCIALDTACSSSLVAVAQACESLLAHTSDLALAGGVYVLPGPSMHIKTSQAGMLSDSGKCYAFDERANGFVHGEGVGVVLLKRLPDAIRDGDSIRGIIKGWGVNQDGKTNGITAPSVHSQTQLIREVYDRFGIDPETITLVEAHGTGTKLGDPIEVEALIASFRHYTAKAGYCALGSVKSNIGHLGKAAGIAGMIKLLMAMQHRLLPPAANYRKLNPLIELEDSPFYVNTALTAWESAPGVPRRAGISSFGFSGTNAHLILEEYEPEPSRPTIERFGPHVPLVFTLSAQTKESLLALASALRGWLSSCDENDLVRAAYTLQTGRDAMENRLAVLAVSVGDLSAKLERFEQGAPEEDALLTGTASRGQEVGSEEHGAAWTRGDDWVSAAKAWVKGAAVDWRAFWEGSGILKIGLPGYPFARERYWLQADWRRSAISGDSPGRSVSRLHPLVQRNVSDHSERRFASVFTGDEFFMRDHQVHGRRVMPGTAFLEMAAAAFRMANGSLKADAGALRLSHIAWTQMLAAESDPIEVHIGLLPVQDDSAPFEIHSRSEDAPENRTIYAKGRASLLGDAAIGASIDIDALRERCRKGWLRGEECYAYLEEAGMRFGPSHRGLEAIYIGQDMALAKLSLPSSADGDTSDFLLHPGLLDSALQASIGLIADPDGRLPVREMSLGVPFALEELTVYGPLRASMWAYVRRSKTDAAATGLQKLDIDLCGEDGVVLASLRSFANRNLANDLANISKSGGSNVLIAAPVWLKPDVAAIPPVDSMTRTVILCETEEHIRLTLPDLLGEVECHVLQSERDKAEDRFAEYAVELLETIRRRMNGAKNIVLLQLIIGGGNKERELMAGLSGLLKTAQLENPGFRGQLIVIEPGEEAVSLASKLAQDAKLSPYDRIRYEQGRRLISAWEEWTPAVSDSVSLPWKDGGVYLITGGAGGLGVLFAEEIVRHARDVRIILLGRSPLEGNLEKTMKRLRMAGGEIEYERADVADREAVEGVVRRILNRCGALNGIIHAAGIIRDSYIIKKTEAEVRAVLAPKTTGLANADWATRDIGLDFFVAFSSGAGVTGNPGQADYAMANAYMDAFAAWRQSMVDRGLRRGRTLSVNWPLWSGGGMGVDAELEERIYRKLGMAAMRAESGFQALYALLASDLTQAMVVEGEPERIRSVFLGPELSPAPELSLPSSGDGSERPEAEDGEKLFEQSIHFFKHILSSVAKLPEAKIDPKAPLERYGIDSIMVIRLTDELENYFGSLSKTIFFEYQNLRDVTGYFLERHKPKLLKILGTAEESNGPATGKPETREQAKSPSGSLVSAAEAGIPKLRESMDFPSNKARRGNRQDIAIIGLAGRYPGANDMRQFWDNLAGGVDSIVEIPADRWEYQRYYDEKKNTAGKTYGKWGGFIDGVDGFDPLFFNITPKEAESIDPQERLFLQCVYETIEDAGYTRETLVRNDEEYGSERAVGVFAGVMYEEYPLFGAQDQALGGHLALIGSPSSIANRVSYWFNFQGPSMAVDTMCSSSLTAIHLACQSLALGECKLAVAGGVNVSIHPNKYLLLGHGGFLSSRGRCESFGRHGDGYVPAEGVGCVLLKPLEQAEADGDRIYGVIKGSAVNHGGKTNGYTVPNPNAQANLIRRALAESGMEPSTIGYIEAHGTGTALGDPIEIAGLAKAFSEGTGEMACPIGSVKSNIGHAESAAGIAGLSKVLLQMEAGLLVPSLHAEELNPNIDFASTPFYVQRELAEWRRPMIRAADGRLAEGPRRAGISSFGAGGSNVHLLVEEYISPPKDASDTGNRTGACVFVLSARTEDRLREHARRMLRAMEAGAIREDNRMDAAYTLQVGREAMEERLAIVADSAEELKHRLTRWLDGASADSGVYRGQVKPNKETMEALTAGGGLNDTIHRWMATGMLAQLADLWVKGLEIDWNRLYDGKYKPRRIGLPSYPFAKSRYWAASADVRPAALPIQEDTSGRISLLRKRWKPCAAEPARRQPRAVAILKTKETEGLASELIRYFPNGQTIDADDLVAAGNPSHGEGASFGFDGFIDLVGCGHRERRPDGWLAWLQQFVDSRIRHGIALLGVTRGLEASRDREINLAGADRAALYRLLQSEYGELRSRHMDADSSIGDRELAAFIAEEFAIEDGAVEVRYADGIRYKAGLEEEAIDNPGTPASFPSDQVLLITGGTRGLGYLCARHLVEKLGVKKLVLTGKQELPPRSQWEQLDGVDPALSRKIRDLLELEALGAQVEAVALSLTDEQAVGEAIGRMKSSLGPIGGVLHCAGITDPYNPAFIRKPVSSMLEVLAPKKEGLQVLFRAVRAEPLKFFICFSSVSAIIPSLGAGLSDYAMANAYMDYFAEAHRSEAPVVSVQWPNWKETGMGETKSLAYRRTGIGSLANEEGLAILDAILAGNTGTVVLPIFGGRRQWNPERLLDADLGAGNQPSSPAVSAPSPNGTTLAFAEGRIRSWLTAMLAEEFKMEPSELDSDTPFHEYGMNSILLAQFTVRLDRELGGVSLDPSLFLEYPTIAMLARQLTEAVPGLLATASSKEAPERDPSPSESSDSRQPREDSAVAPYRSVGKIAVVGMACHFPNSPDIDRFWRNLLAGKDAIGEIPPSRRNSRSCGSAATAKGAFLDDIEQFDPGYFQIPEDLARFIDPLQRQWLEVSAEALADAGYGKKDLWGRNVGVYAGARTANFSYQYPDNCKDRIVGVGQNFIAAHLAHLYNFKGPNMVVDTACSSALTAVHLAVRAIQSGEAEMALAGGVEILLDGEAFIRLGDAGVLSPDGKCKPFAADADGIGLGEGCGIIVLKPLDQAIRDGNKIYGIIDGSALNNDGRTMGVTTPNPEAQQALIEKAIDDAKVSPRTIGYVEAHGTGTLIGDPIELRALSRVFAPYADGQQYCGVGSVKSNVGHLLSASGAAGLIKALLAVSQGRLPASLHCERPNPRFGFADSPLYLVQKTCLWDGVQGVRRAGISSFGLGGNNAHVLVSDEGIPAANRATLEPRGQAIKFNRTRLWPDAAASDDDSTEDDFMAMFEIKTLAGGDEA